MTGGLASVHFGQLPTSPLHIISEGDVPVKMSAWHTSLQLALRTKTYIDRWIDTMVQGWLFPGDV